MSNTLSHKLRSGFCRSAYFSLIRPDKWLAVLMLIGLFIRGVFLIDFGFHPGKMLDGDSLQYITIAKNLLSEGKFSQSLQAPYEPDSVRTPVYPLFIAAILKTTRGSLFLVMILQFLISLTSFWFFWKIASMLSYPEPIIKIALVLFALDLLTIIYSATIMTESIFTLLLLAAVFTLLRFFQKKRVVLLLTAAVILGLAALCRPIAAYIIIAFLPIFLVYNRGKSPVRLKNYAIFTIIFISVLLPWLIRNQRTFGFFHLSSLQSYNLLFHATLVIADDENLTYREASSYLDQKAIKRGFKQDLPIAQRMQIYRDVALAEIFKRPLTFIKETLKGILALFLDPGRQILNRILLDEPVENIGFLNIYAKSGLPGIFKALFQKSPDLIFAFLAYGLYLTLFFFFFLLGLAHEIKEKQTYRLLLPLAISGYFILITGSMGYSRFRVPIVPFLALVAAMGAAKLIKVKFGNAGSNETSQ